MHSVSSRVSSLSKRLSRWHSFLVAVAACRIQYDGVASHFLLNFLYNDELSLYHSVTTELVSI